MIYPSAKVIIRHPDRKNSVLLIKRSLNGMRYYEPAGGKLEYNFDARIAESFEQCAIREAQEEVGALIDIGDYLGSYYFFWEIDPNKLSVCAVFEGIVKGIDPHFTGNSDAWETPLEPVWVSTEDIISNQIPINPAHIGLDKLMRNYCLLQQNYE